MDEVKFKLPRFWTMSKPVLSPAESELENLNSAGTFLFTSKLRYWGFSLKCITSVRLDLYDENDRKIKGVSGNYLDYKELSLGSSAKLSFLIEVPRNVSYVKVKPMLFEDCCTSWYGRLLGGFALMTSCLWLIFTVVRIIF